MPRTTTRATTPIHLSFLLDFFSASSHAEFNLIPHINISHHPLIHCPERERTGEDSRFLILRILLLLAEPLPNRIPRTINHHSRLFTKVNLRQHVLLLIRRTQRRRRIRVSGLSIQNRFRAGRLRDREMWKTEMISMCAVRRGRMLSGGLEWCGRIGYGVVCLPWLEIHCLRACAACVGMWRGYRDACRRGNQFCEFRVTISSFLPRRSCSSGECEEAYREGMRRDWTKRRGRDKNAVSRTSPAIRARGDYQHCSAQDPFV